MVQRHLKIELDDFLSALAFGLDGIDGGWYLDCDSGEIILATDGADEVPDDLEDNPRYTLIGQIDSSTSFWVMEGFVAQLDDAPAVDRLERALRGRKPFRASKTCCLTIPRSRPPGSPSSKPPTAAPPTPGARNTASWWSGRSGRLWV
jgi:Uncharacterised protein family (UPF0158)